MMKQILFVVLSVSLIYNTILSQAKTLTAKEIWQKCISTLGKAETLSKLKTLSFTTTINGTDGEYTNHVKIKYPDKLVSEDVVAGKLISTTVVNGKKGIHKSVKGTRHLSEKELKHYRETCLIIPEAHYLKLGYKIELLGTIKIAGDKCYDLMLKKGTDIKRYSININTFRIAQLKTSGSLAVLETKMIDGIRVITKSQFTSLNYISQMNLFNHVVNSKMDDNIFRID